MNKILIINGPNLNKLGYRDKDTYGKLSYGDLKSYCKKIADGLGIEIEFFQSNFEGELVEKIQNSLQNYQGVIINPGALTHYSIALRDALEMFNAPKVEVHLSNIFSREEYRRKTYTGEVCDVVISGGKFLAYDCALNIISRLLKE